MANARDILPNIDIKYVRGGACDTCCMCITDKGYRGDCILIEVLHTAIDYITSIGCKDGHYEAIEPLREITPQQVIDAAVIHSVHG